MLIARKMIHMKTSVEHTDCQETSSADPRPMDRHVPIYSGKWGYTTEAGKQALIASIEQAERDYDAGKAVRMDADYLKIRREGLIKQLKAEGIPK